MGRRGFVGFGHYMRRPERFYSQMSPSARAAVDRLCEGRTTDLPMDRIRAEAVDVVMREIERPCRCQKCDGISLEDRLAVL